MFIWLHRCIVTVNDRTTIQVDERTLKNLERLKKEMNASSYKEVIEHLLSTEKRLEISEKGKFPKLKRFRREKLDRFD